MNVRRIVAAAQADADICNALDPPVIGTNVGGGAHVVIPGDWQARIALGQDVPGCQYHRIETAGPFAGGMTISPVAQVQLATPAVVNALTAPQQTQAAALNVKLVTAVVVSAAQVAQPQQAEVIP